MPRSAVLVFLATFALYVITAAPGIGMGDTAMLLDNARRLNLSAHVNNHPLSVAYFWLFTWIPLGTFEYRANLGSALLGAGAVAMLFLAVGRWLRNKMVAVVVATVFAVSQSQWWHSTLVECYAMNALLTVIWLWLLVVYAETGSRKTLYAIFLVSGFALTNHVLLGVLGLGAGVVMLLTPGSLVERSKLFLLCSVWSVVGALPWLALLVRDASHAGLGDALYGAFFGKFRGIMFQGTALHGLKELAVTTLFQFPSPALLLLPVGVALFVWSLRPQRASPSRYVAAGALTVLIGNAGFFAFYHTWDRFAFLLPSFIVLIFSTAPVIPHLLTWGRGSAARVSCVALLWILSLVSPPWLYRSVVLWGQQPGSWWYSRHNDHYTLNTHRGAAYIVDPIKFDYNDAEELSRLLSEKLPRGAVFLDDDSRTYYPLEYLQRWYQRRTDISYMVMNSWGFDGWGVTEKDVLNLVEQATRDGRPFFVISLQHPFTFLRRTEGAWQFVPFALDTRRWVYQLVRRSDALPPTEPLSLATLLDVEGAHVYRRFDVWPEDQPMGGFGSLWREGDHLFAAFERENAKLEFLVTVPQSATELAFVFTTAPDFGIFEISLDEVVLGDPVNLHSERVGIRPVAVPLPERKTGQAQVLSIRAIGRDSRSSGMKFGVDTVESR